ncbi:MAG: N-acetyl sugar amidotransferase [Acidobacteria bacterium]|nr:N-acetyl sugar amidotransferase [Acidobacteriota bacterium]
MASTQNMCVRCVMDTTDPDIQFDETGVCNHCRYYDDLAQTVLLSEDEKAAKLQEVVAEIKAAGQGKSYDCILGISGGVDSTYLAHILKKLGLRPLAVHLDNGWNSELAVSNVEKVLKFLEIDLYTRVLDWEEFRDLQLSFLKASVPDAEIPTDHAIMSTLYQVTAEQGLRHIISGANVVTEAVLPTSWTYGIGDWRYISGIHRQFGKEKLKSYPHFTRDQWYYYTFIKKINYVCLLDYLPYYKKEAMRVLEEELGWQYYGGKHYESIYTRFFQGYILPTKFNIDKRKAHLSNLICSDQMTREEALAELAHNAYLEDQSQADLEYVTKKLELTAHEFQMIMSLPRKSYKDYKTYQNVTSLDRLRVKALGVAKAGYQAKKKLSGA